VKEKVLSRIIFTRPFFSKKRTLVRKSARFDPLFIINNRNNNGEEE